MKISPLAQGTGVPAASEGTIGQTASPTKLARAKLIASGQEVPRETTGDQQADRVKASVKSIKMRTQVSPDRTPVQEVIEAITEVPKDHNNEPALEDEATKPLSPQFAALAKAKRALQVKERELAQREEALKTQAPAGQEDIIARLKASPLTVLQEAGVTYDQLTEAIINNQNSPIDAQKLRSDIKKELLEELSGQFTTRDQQAEAQVLNDIKREAIALASQGDKYEAIREAKAYDDVKDLVHRVWQKGWPDKGYEPGHILDVAEAAEYVENQLIEESLPFAKLSKVQSRLTPAQEALLEQRPTKPNTKVMRTLTNRDSARPVMDRRARALAAFAGTLKRG
jgi:hypothetical protein